MTDYQTLKVEQRGRIVVITLNRPDAANGINSQMARELVAASHFCKTDKNIKAVVLTAQGKFFCAGGDINEMAGFAEQGSQKVKALADNLHEAISNFCRMDAPVIVAVNGVAAGGGFSLSITGDLVIAAESAAFTMAYTRAGLSPDGSSSYFLPRLIGLRRAQEMAFCNNLLSAAQALDWGLINKVVSDESLLEQAVKLAEDLAAGSLGSNSMVKKLFLSSFENDLEAQMDAESLGISQTLGSRDGQEGMHAFLQKRRPEFN